MQRASRETIERLVPKRHTEKLTDMLVSLERLYPKLSQEVISNAMIEVLNQNMPIIIELAINYSYENRRVP